MGYIPERSSPISSFRSANYSPPEISILDHQLGLVNAIQDNEKCCYGHVVPTQAHCNHEFRRWSSGRHYNATDIVHYQSQCKAAKMPLEDPKRALKQLSNTQWLPKPACTSRWQTSGLGDCSAPLRPNFPTSVHRFCNPAIRWKTSGRKNVHL